MAAYCGILVAGWMFQSTDLAAWQRENLHWNYFLHGFMFLIPVVSILGLGRSAGAYGLRIPAWREGMNIGVLGAAIFLTFVLFGVLSGSLSASDSLADFPIGTVIYQVIFVAVFEEMFFRGFLQHELGRSWPRGGDSARESVHFGWLATAFLFGLGHGLGGFNPFRSSYEFGTGIFVSTFVLGCVLGLLRVRSGSVWPSVILHLAANFSTAVFVSPVSKTGDLLMLAGFFTALPAVAVGCGRNRPESH